MRMRDVRAVLILAAVVEIVAAAATSFPQPQPRSPEKELAQIAELLEVSAGKVVADVGAGGGQ